jgi:hypothetical protein
MDAFRLCGMKRSLPWMIQDKVRTKEQTAEGNEKERKCGETVQQCGAVRNDEGKVCVENKDESLSFEGERLNILGDTRYSE